MSAVMLLLTVRTTSRAFVTVKNGALMRAGVGVAAGRRHVVVGLRWRAAAGAGRGAARRTSVRAARRSAAPATAHAAVRAATGAAALAAAGRTGRTSAGPAARIAAHSTGRVAARRAADAGHAGAAAAPRTRVAASAGAPRAPAALLPPWPAVPCCPRRRCRCPSSGPDRTQRTAQQRERPQARAEGAMTSRHWRSRGLLVRKRRTAPPSVLGHLGSGARASLPRSRGADGRDVCRQAVTSHGAGGAVRGRPFRCPESRSVLVGFGYARGLTRSRRHLGTALVAGWSSPLHLAGRTARRTRSCGLNTRPTSRAGVSGQTSCAAW